MNDTGNLPSATGPESTPQPVGRSGVWRFVRFCLLGMATLVTLFVLFHVEENWRGKRAWNNYKSTMEAQGAVFEFEALAPPAVPDDQNFAMTPLLRPVLDLYPPDTLDADGNRLVWKDPEGKARAEAVQVRYSAETESAPRPRNARWRLGERFHLEDWQRYYAASTHFSTGPNPRSRAGDVLSALSRFDAELAELKQAGERPYSRFNIRYEEEIPFAIMLPHLGVLRNIARVAQLKAIAELEAGQVDAAFEDVELLFTLADCIEDEPFLISHLVRIALLNIATQTVWEGMMEHRWTSAHLEQFQQQFESINLVSELRRSFEAERTFGAEICELVARRPALLWDLADSSGTLDVAGAAINLVPRGWWYLEGVNHSRAFDDYLLAVMPEDPRDLEVRLIESRWGELESLLTEPNAAKQFLHHKTFMRLLLPALGQAAEKSVEAQAVMRLAAIATGLERYHLESGDYPDELSALAPGWIPHVPNCPVTHEPFHYERLGDDAFRLWSVGWDGVDDDGQVLYEMKGVERRYVRGQADWVWPSTQGMRLKESPAEE